MITVNGKEMISLEFSRSVYDAECVYALADFKNGTLKVCKTWKSKPTVLNLKDYVLDTSSKRAHEIIDICKLERFLNN